MVFLSPSGQLSKIGPQIWPLALPSKLFPVYAPFSYLKHCTLDTRRRWVDNIKMDLLEIGWGGVDWIGLAQDRDKWRALVNAVMNLLVP
jgi:hypothetical protein